MAGSASQTSQLVQRGGGTGATTGPRQAANPAANRRRTSARLAPKSGFFYTEDRPLIELSVEQVLYLAIGFIALVFVLHIFGKIRGA